MGNNNKKNFPTGRRAERCVCAVKTSTSRPVGGYSPAPAAPSPHATSWSRHSLERLGWSDGVSGLRGRGPLFHLRQAGNRFRLHFFYHTSQTPLHMLEWAVTWLMPFCVSLTVCCIVWLLTQLILDVLFYPYFYAFNIIFYFIVILLDSAFYYAGVMHFVTVFWKVPHK